jgi:hypothetical protein
MMAGPVMGVHLLIADDEGAFQKMFTQQGVHVVVAVGAGKHSLGSRMLIATRCLARNGYPIRKGDRSPQAGGSVPAVAVTGYGIVEDRIRIPRWLSGALPKPVELAELGNPSSQLSLPQGSPASWQGSAITPT